jgi:hypothetical protein
MKEELFVPPGLLRLSCRKVPARKDMQVCNNVMLILSFHYKTRGWLQTQPIFGEQVKF